MNKKSKNKQQTNNNTIINKFQNLNYKDEFIVKSYSNLIESKFGKSYILVVKNKSTNEEQQLWSTKHLANFIYKMKPTKIFSFIVEKDLNRNQNNLYPVIDGFNNQPIFNELCSDSE